MARLDGPSTLALVGDFIASTLYRVIWPGNALQRRGYPAYSMPMGDDLFHDVVRGWNPSKRPVDAILLPRVYWKPGEEADADRQCAQQRAGGQVLIAEWDDDVFTPASYGQMHLLEPEVPRAAIEAEREARIYALRQMDGATASSPYLAAVMREYTDKPVLSVPNALDWAAFRGVYNATPRTVPGLTIGWAGGKRLEHDVAPMAEAWGRIAERFPNVTFVVAGYHPDAITAAVPSERLVCVPWADMGQFPRIYRDMDIGCCPLANAPFNRSKSICKALEYGAAGCAVVYSPTVYGQELRHKRDGLEADTADDWERAVAYLIEHPGERRALARRWQRRVQQYHTVEATCHRWVTAWDAIVKHARATRPRLVAV